MAGRGKELWVFGYGSLMWRPGFAFEEARPAHLIGAHRSLCVYSFHHRGSPEQPGLVLGLDQGGACRGLAFRIVPGKEEETIGYLREREQVTDVYKEAERQITLLGREPHQVPALCYLTDRSHPQYAGRLSLPEQARLVRAAKGLSGTNLDYVLNTVQHLEEAGIHDAPLMALVAVLSQESEVRDQRSENSDF